MSYYTVSTANPEEPELIGDFKCIHSEPCLSSTALYKEIASSLICFAPYSFQDKYKTMVTTSFPSKMMDYLSAGRYILVYSPDYSSSANYFKSHNLEEVVCNENTNLLRDTIVNQLLQKNDYSKEYRTVLSQNHSFESISKVILNCLVKKTAQMAVNIAK